MSHMIIEYNCRAHCIVHHDVMQLRKITSNSPHKKSPSQPLHDQLVQAKRPLCQMTVAAMSPRGHPSTQIELPPQGERGVTSPTLGPPSSTELPSLHAVRPTSCGLPSHLGFARWLRLRFCLGATADFVMGHKGFAQFTIGCRTLRRVATTIS